MCLAELIPGESGRVAALPDSSVGKRLKSMGIDIGSDILCLMFSPLGDPVIYRSEGMTVALRKSTAKNILLEKDVIS